MKTPTTIYYGHAPTPFGTGLIGWTEQGLLLLHLQQTRNTQLHETLSSAYPDSILIHSGHEAIERLDQAFQYGRPGHALHKPALMLQGTAFQLKVWQALRGIPFGEVRTYGALAESLGHPGAARAVGTAIAANQLAYVIPCHRVIRASGDSGQYRWGAERKAQMLAWETRQLADSHAAR